MKKCNIALYIRISNSDINLNKNLLKAESDSIISQRNFLNDFLDRNTELSEFSRIEYVDDGFSGTITDRPKFKEMIKNAENGNINTIIVRDFSRFFRDYIESGYYLETVFPLLNIRFISVNDNYDSNDYIQTAGDFEVALRSLVYASYSRDTSIKIKNTRLHMAKEGKYLGGFPPFGYKMHDTIKNKLYIDENSAKYVREIFDYALNGLSVNEICVKLNEQEVITPVEYFRSINKNSTRYKNVDENTKWNYNTVYSILRNIVYKGDLESHKVIKEDLYSKKYIRREPIIIKGTHEPIVDNEIFENAQLAIKRIKYCGRNNSKNSYDYPLKSLIKCGNCKKMLTRHKHNKKNYYSCKKYKVTLIENCKEIGIYEEELEEILLNTIKNTIKFLIKQSSTDISKITLNKNPHKKLEKNFETELKNLKQRKLKLYENYADIKITREVYFQKTNEINSLIDDISKKLEDKQKVFANKNSNDNDNTSCENFKINILTYEIAHTFVDSIYIHQNNKIEINMKFKNIFYL